MNKIYLLLPALNEAVAGEEVAYLKVLDENFSSDDFLDLLKDIKTIGKIGKLEENLQLFYDKSKFGALYKKVKTELHVSTPSLVNALSLLDDFHDISKEQDSIALWVNGMLVTSGLLNACVDSNANVPLDSALVNEKAINNEENIIVISKSQTDSGQNVNVKNTDIQSIFTWLATHKSPERAYDKEYKKTRTDREKR